MKRWAWLTIGLYFLVLAIILFFLPFLTEWPELNDKPIDFEWLIPTSITAAVMAMLQGLLLVVRVKEAQRRPKRKRHIAFVAGGAGAAMAILTLSVFLAYGEAWPDAEDGTAMSDWAFLGMVIVTWSVWAAIFYRLYLPSADQPDRYMALIFRSLFVGSILELLVAVPCHVIVRRRDECCAGMFTGFAIAMGLAVMLMAFGPSVFILFKRRMASISPPTPICFECRYDLRGSVAAGSTHCPECGKEIKPYTYDDSTAQ